MSAAYTGLMSPPGSLSTFQAQVELVLASHQALARGGLQDLQVSLIVSRPDVLDIPRPPYFRAPEGLRRNLREYESHHNQHRPHRSLLGAPLKPLPEPVPLRFGSGCPCSLPAADHLGRFSPWVTPLADTNSGSMQKAFQETVARIPPAILECLESERDVRRDCA
jgi:hypothetical protein